VSGTSTSNPSIATSRHLRSHASRVKVPATGPATCSNTSASTLGPSRLRAWVIPPAVGTDQPASQQFHADNEPVTLVATSV
jgi:hypothetical protein